MRRKYGHQWDENNTKFEVFLEKMEDAVQTFYNATINKIIRNRKRKIKVRIDDYDAWNADNTLAHIILPLLKEVREGKNGTPYVDDEDVPEHIRSTAAKPKEEEWDTDEFHEARWEYVMSEMIHSFECEVNDMWEDQFYSGESDYRIVPDDYEGKKVYTLQKGPLHTFTVDVEGKKKAWARRQEGLRLFGKYYHSLWT
jgi:hypothetical protein